MLLEGEGAGAPQPHSVTMSTQVKDDRSDSQRRSERRSSSTSGAESPPNDSDDPAGGASASGVNAPENDRNDEIDENDTGRGFDPTCLPEEVYDHLPDTLNRPASYLDEGHERDTFLTGALPVCAGAMPKVRFRYGGQWLSLNHYMAVVAPPGAGKGKLRVAKELGEELDERIYESSRKDIQRWKDRRDAEEEDAGSRPQQRALYLPGDSSAAELKHMLQANPNAVMFETEFKTVGAVLSQDWGQFRDVLLKSFHNESVTVARRGEDLLRIEHPAVSVTLSGTPGTFGEVIDGVEDGLFSRFCFYLFEDEAEWVPQFSDEKDRHLEEYTEKAAERLDSIHRSLSERDEPLYIYFTDEIRDRHTTACRTAMKALKSQDALEGLSPNVKRAGVNALRFAGIFAVLRLDERGVDLSTPKSVEISEGDLRGGLYLAFAYLSHALRVADWLEVKEGEKGLHEGHRNYLDALPEGAFDTGDANRVAEEQGIGERKAYRWRNKFVEKGLLVDEGYGSWRKPSDETAPGVLSVHSVLSVLFDRNGVGSRPKVEEEGAPF